MDLDHHNNNNNGAGTCAEDIAQPSDSQAPSRDRKKGRKGTPWTEEEHRMFLAGLQKLGKGDWKGIAHGYVTSRTPTQVASHAQKYFIRQSNISKKKRRSSLFDITSESRVIAEEERDESSIADCPLQQSPSCTEDPMNAAPCSRDMKTDASSIGSEGGMLEEEEVPRLVENAAVPQSMQECFLTTPPAFALLVPGWGGFSSSSSQCPIVRPTPILPTSPIQIDLWNGVSELNLSAFPSPPPLSLKLSEHSAFQANPCKKINQSGGKAISVV